MQPILNRISTCASLFMINKLCVYVKSKFYSQGNGTSNKENVKYRPSDSYQT